MTSQETIKIRVDITPSTIPTSFIFEPSKNILGMTDEKWEKLPLNEQIDLMHWSARTLLLWQHSMTLDGRKRV